MCNNTKNMKCNSIQILMSRSEIDPADMQLTHKSTQKYNNCCCSPPRRFPTVSVPKNV